jgi:rhamnosyltransferase
MNSQLVNFPSVAVCLAAFNGALWLPQQIDSIFSQLGISVTLFISVDQSSDGTEAWVDKASQNNSRIVVLPHGRKFGGAARNFFRLLLDLDFSGFDYVAFADQDDIWLSDKLIRAHQVLLNTGADAYSSNVLAFWSNGGEAYIRKSQPQQCWDFLFEAAGPGCTYVMKTKLVSAIQDLLEQRWEDIQHVGLHDWFSYAFARAQGYRWIIDDHAGMLYRQHEENQVGVNVGWKAAVHRARKVLSGWGLGQSVLIAGLVGLGQDPFVRHWSLGSRLGLIWLALHAGQCRRRLRDKVLFALSCVALSAVGSRRK